MLFYLFKKIRRDLYLLCTLRLYSIPLAFRFLQKSSVLLHDREITHFGDPPLRRSRAAPNLAPANYFIYLLMKHPSQTNSNIICTQRKETVIINAYLRLRIYRTLLNYVTDYEMLEHKQKYFKMLI